MIPHWHWTLHRNHCIDFFLSGENGLAHIPLRNPFDITDSWERRYHDEVGKEQSEVHQAMLDQTKFIRQFSLVAVYKVEDIPLVRGQGPRPEGRPTRDDLLKTPRMQELWRFMHENAFVTDLYCEYYSDEELWWLG